jgi:hypothetical protein
MMPDSLDKAAREHAARVAERKFADDCVDEVYRLAHNAIGVIGGYELAAGVSGIDSGDLHRAVKRRGRYLTVDVIAPILRRLRQHNAALATELGAALVLPGQLGVFPLVEISKDEKLERCERLIKSFPHGERMLDEAYRGRQ